MHLDVKPENIFIAYGGPGADPVRFYFVVIIVYFSDLFCFYYLVLERETNGRLGWRCFVNKIQLACYCSFFLLTRTKTRRYKLGDLGLINAASNRESFEDGDSRYCFKILKSLLFNFFVTSSYLPLEVCVFIIPISLSIHACID